MITIQIDGKTYSTRKNHLFEADYITRTMMIWRDTGILEEVKENKQSLTLPEMEYKGEREYYRNGIKLKILKESPSYDEMVSMGMPTELTGCQGVITEHNIGSMGYHQDVENTILRNQEDWKREHGFLSEEDRPEHPKGYLYPETINSYYDTNKTKEWNYQEYQKQLKKAQDEWWAGVKENKEPGTSILEKLREFLTKRYTEIKWTAMKSIEYGQWKGIAEALRELNLLTSLENSSKTLNSSQFTPGQEETIEDKIELVPKWTESYHITGCTQNTREKQIELLTIAVNKLIAKQN